MDGLLGIGGFGEVYRVRDERAGEAVRALKLQRIVGTDARVLESLQSEFALLASLSHPNLARVHDFGQIGDDVAYFTQELVAGKPLIETSLKPDDPDAVLVWAQLCRALHYLHSRGILHRDVKPSNVIVDLETRHLTLLDFGIASAFGAFDNQTLVGTFAYMAPEAIAGGPVDARSDLYSLGVTLYRQARGQVPFRGSPSEVLAAQLAVEPEPLEPGVASEPVARLIGRLMRKEPGMRPASALEVLRALGTANGVPVEEESSESLASYVLSARFVGHERELERLSELARSDDAHGRAVLVVGEGGSGKSRLLREARQRAQLARRAWVLVSVKRTWAAKNVLHGIARAVLDEHVVRDLDEDDRRELARALPELRKPRERIGIALDPERARRARIEALARALVKRFARNPGVLAVEDLHWASSDVLALLEQLTQAARRLGARCLFVLAARPGEMADALESGVAAERLSCDELSPEASLRLVDSMFGARDLLAGTELGEALASSTRTAQYVQESLRMALERGAIVRAGDEWRIVGGVPALSALEVLASRFDRLPAEGRRVALALAVLGGEAMGPEVASVAGQDWSRAAVALRDLVRSGVIEDHHDARGRATYTMHDRYRDVVLERLPAAAIRRAHRRAARLSKQSARGDWRALFDAADHFRAAGDSKEAIDAAVACATLAERGGRPDSGAAALEAAIVWQRELGDVPPHLLLRRFDLSLVSGLIAGALEALAELEAEEARADAALSVEIALRRARLAMRRGEPARAREQCESALARARELQATRLETELFLLLAQIDDDYGNIERAFEEFQRAGELAERERAPAVEAQAWLGASLAAVRLGTTGPAATFAERALEAAGAARDGVLRAEALRNLGNVRRERGDSRAALRFYRRAVRAARDGGSPESEAKALNNLGTMCQWVGLVPEALAALRRSLELKERLGLHASAVLTKNNLGALLLAIGRHDQARWLFESIVEETRAAAPIVVALAYSNWADLCALEQNFDRAVDLYRSAHAMNRERALAGQLSHALSGLVRVLTMRDEPGDRDEARELLGQLETLSEQGDLAETHWRYHTAAAMFLDREGEPAKAVQHARRAASKRIDPTTQFSDVFGTVLEARWLEAILLARASKPAAAERAARRAHGILMRLSRHVGSAGDQQVFLEQSPLHRAIIARRLDTPPGWSWFPREDETPLESGIVSLEEKRPEGRAQ